MQLPATVTLEQATALVHGLESALSAGEGPLTVDASALTTFDTSAVAVLLHAHRLAQAAGRAFSVTGAPDKLAQLARLYGVEALLSLAAPAATNPPTAP
jgi:phospholipid transport system transporter-binding protein